MTKPVVLGELQHHGVVRHLGNAHAAALAATGLVDVQPTGAGRWLVRPAGRVGAVRIGDLDVLVRPKVDIQRLMFLLGYAADPGFRPEDASGVAKHDLWSALAESLARHSERALAHGLLHGYLTVDEALPLVRGRIRIADQIATRPGRLLPLEVRYDEYATDIVENRLLRTAVRRMAAVPRVDPEVRTRLAYLDNRLNGVHVLPARSPPPAWRLTRLNAHYAAAVRLAEIVLRHQSVEPGPDGAPVAAFIVSMAKVFEDFVTTALREALAPYPGHTNAQHRTHLDEPRTIAIRPDIVHTINGRPMIVFDAKYKLEDPSAGFPGTDAYQMLAYCTALQVPAGWLLYAHGTTTPGPRRVRHTAIDIIHYPLDLSAPPTALLHQVATLANAAYTASTAPQRQGKPGETVTQTPSTASVGPGANVKVAESRRVPRST